MALVKAFEASSIPARSTLEPIVDEPTDNEAVLLLPHRKQIKVLNELGARTWDLINGDRSVTRIAATISDEYAVDMEIALADTLAFLNELLGLGIVVAHEANDRDPSVD